jgi:hypothetical protein
MTRFRPEPKWEIHPNLACKAAANSKINPIPNQLNTDFNYELSHERNKNVDILITTHSTDSAD